LKTRSGRSLTFAKKTRILVAKAPAQQEGKLKLIGGSACDDWNQVLANQTLNTLWVKNSDEATIEQQLAATSAALVGISPRDELESMLAAQLIAGHNATMECYRRAMLGEQTFEGRRENLNQANKLSRTYATLLEALNRHRGKGQQKVIVEHVHVHAGGQAVVGMVETPGGGIHKKTEDQPHAKQITHAPQSSMWGQTRSGSPCRSPAMPNGRCRMHGGKSPGAPKNNKNAIKHGHFSAAATARRQQVANLLRVMRALSKP
jgi:hypothetical protein